MGKIIIYVASKLLRISADIAMEWNTADVYIISLHQTYFRSEDNGQSRLTNPVGPWLVSIELAIMFTNSI